jgi:hypothetical protein
MLVLPCDPCDPCSEGEGQVVVPRKRDLLSRMHECFKKCTESFLTCLETNEQQRVSFSRIVWAKWSCTLLRYPSASYVAETYFEVKYSVACVGPLALMPIVSNSGRRFDIACLPQHLEKAVLRRGATFSIRQVRLLVYYQLVYCGFHTFSSPHQISNYI